MRSPRTATKSSPRSPQLEKARAQQQRPNAAIKKERKKEREGGREGERERERERKKEEKKNKKRKTVLAHFFGYWSIIEAMAYYCGFLVLSISSHLISFYSLKDQGREYGQTITNLSPHQEKRSEEKAFLSWFRISTLSYFSLMFLSRLLKTKLVPVSFIVFFVLCNTFFLKWIYKWILVKSHTYMEVQL